MMGNILFMVEIGLWVELINRIIENENFQYEKTLKNTATKWQLISAQWQRLGN